MPCVARVVKLQSGGRVLARRDKQGPYLRFRELVNRRLLLGAELAWSLGNRKAGDAGGSICRSNLSLTRLVTYLEAKQSRTRIVIRNQRLPGPLSIRNVNFPQRTFLGRKRNRVSRVVGQENFKNWTYCRRRKHRQDRACRLNQRTVKG